MKKEKVLYARKCEGCGTWQDIWFDHIGGDELTDEDGNNYWVNRYRGSCPICFATNNLAVALDEGDDELDD